MSMINSNYTPPNINTTTSFDHDTNEETHAQSTSRSRSKRGIGATARRWPQNSTITIAFIGTTKEQEELVKQGFDKFTPHINLKSKYVSGPDADIRVAPNDGKGANASS